MRGHALRPRTMIVIATSQDDVASVNIHERLLELGSWEEDVPFDAHPSYRSEDRRLVTLRKLHLHRDHLDRDLRRSFGAPPEVVVFPSRHSAQSGIPSFTVHPLGNFGDEAAFGGRPRTLVPTAPHWMTQALRLLKEEAAESDREVTFESSHHGPYLEAPAFFIEIGSDIHAWENEEAGRIMARALLRLHPQEGPVAVGLGGGHYVPRMTDVALTRRVSFGHLIPAYAVSDLAPSVWEEAVAQTPDASLVYVHRKTLRGEVRDKAEGFVAASGLREVTARDLERL